MVKQVHFNEPDVEAEICGLELTFQEVKIRGSKKKIYQVLVQEANSEEVPVYEIFNFDSWDAFLEEYPKPIDFLKYLAELPQWDSSWRQYDRAYYISSSIGHQGLYKLKDLVWFDARVEFGRD